MALSLEADLMGGIINKKAVELYLTHTCKHFGNTAACQAFSTSKYLSEASTEEANACGGTAVAY